MDAHDDTRAEGVELRLRTTGPLPTGALDDLRSLIEVARRPKRLKLLGGQPIERVADPVVASALELADADLDAADAEFARIEERQKAAPPPPADEAAGRIADATANLRAAAEAAAAEGVAFRVRVAVAAPVG